MNAAMSITGRLSPVKYEENMEKDITNKMVNAYWIAEHLLD